MAKFQFVNANKVQRAPRTPRTSITQVVLPIDPVLAQLVEDAIISDNYWVGAFLNTCAKLYNISDNFSKDMISSFDDEGKTFFQALQEGCPEDALKYTNQCVDLIQKSSSLQEAFSIVVMTKMKSFSKEERQGKGKVYTGHRIVTWIHNKFIEQKPLCPVDGDWIPGKRGLDKTYCDFACGTGHFVLDWYDRLMKHWEENQNHYQDLAQTKSEAHKWIVENCLYFADIDPFAIRICKIGLFLKDYSVAELKFNSFCGDSLRGVSFPEKFFDYVAGNPPYNVDVSSPVWAKTDCAYGWFIELGLNHLNPEGVLGLVVPMSWLGLDSKRVINELITKKNTLLGIQSYSQYAAQKEAEWEAIQGITTFILRKGRSKIPEQIEIQRFMTRVATTNFQGQIVHFNNYIGISYNADAEALLRNLSGQYCSFSLPTLLRGGEGRSGKNTTNYVWLNQSVGRFVARKITSRPSSPSLECEHHLKDGGIVCVINADTPAEGHEYHKEWLRCCMVEDAYPGNSTIGLLCSSQDEACLMMGLLNSKLFNWFYSTFSCQKNNTLEKIKTQLPWKPFSKERILSIQELVRQVLIDPSDLTIQAQIDQLIYQEYNLNAKEIEVIEGAFRRTEKTKG